MKSLISDGTHGLLTLRPLDQMSVQNEQSQGLFRVRWYGLRITKINHGAAGACFFLISSYETRQALLSDILIFAVCYSNVYQREREKTGCWEEGLF